jgi:branched-chain amino acid transport system ATP-binding protein
MKPAALELTNLGKTFGGLPAIRDLSFRVEDGERHLILGPNGAGKTTLFNLITGILSPSSGQVRLFGEEIDRLSVHKRIRRGLRRTFQVLTLLPNETVLHNACLAVLGLSSSTPGLFQKFLSSRDIVLEAERLLSSVGLLEMSDRPLSETSYGDRRRLELAMALSGQPRLLLLDEPLAGLSPAEREIVREAINEIPSRITVLMIEHDMDVALSLADRITVMNFGALVLQGSRAEVVSDPRTREVYLGN